MKQLAEALSLHQRGDHDSARQVCAKLLQRDPGNLQALALHGSVCILLGHRQEALASFQRFADRQPRHALCRYSLGNLYRESGDLYKAIESYQVALKYQPDMVDAWNNLGITFDAMGQLERAQQCYQQCLSIDPANALAHYNLGNVLQKQMCHEAAVHAYEKALQISPGYADARFNCGNAWLSMGRPDLALQHYLLIKAGGQSSSLLINVAVAQRRLGLYTQAQATLQQVLDRDPDDVQALLTLSNVYQDMGQGQMAVSILQQAAHKAPQRIDVHFNLGNACMDGRQAASAESAYSVCVSMAPDDSRYLGALAGAQATLWRMEEFDKTFRQLLTTWPPSAAVPMELMLEHCENPQLIKQAAELQAHDSLRNLRIDAKLNTSKADSHSRVRIGYLSPDFGNHPVGLSLVEVLEHANHRWFETIGLSLKAHPNSPIRSRLMNAFDQFHEVSGMDAVQCVQFIRDLNLDVLIDLAGHTTDARPVYLSARLASVQAGYLGFPGTLGLPWNDYLIADAQVIPEDMESCFAEKIIRLPECFFPTDTTMKLDDVIVSRAGEGLPEDAFVFCSFGPAKRISAPMMNAWLDILKQVPDSVLWLQKPHDAVRDQLCAFAERHGVDPCRLVFARFVEDRREHLARHRLADLYLDTFPYNAHSTGRDALFAGVPVLTLCGKTFPSRVGASLLHTLRLPELVTHHLAEYQHKAVELATDTVQLRKLRERLLFPENRDCLFNSRRLAQQLEQVYLQMLEDIAIKKLMR